MLVAIRRQDRTVDAMTAPTLTTSTRAADAAAERWSPRNLTLAAAAVLVGFASFAVTSHDPVVGSHISRSPDVDVTPTLALTVTPAAVATRAAPASNTAQPVTLPAVTEPKDAAPVPAISPAAATTVPSPPVSPSDLTDTTPATDPEGPAGPVDTILDHVDETVAGSPAAEVIIPILEPVRDVTRPVVDIIDTTVVELTRRQS